MLTPDHKKSRVGNPVTLASISSRWSKKVALTGKTEERWRDVVPKISGSGRRKVNLDPS